jgi:hypothetical protein
MTGAAQTHASAASQRACRTAAFRRASRKLTAIARMTTQQICKKTPATNKAAGSPGYM